MEQDNKKYITLSFIIFSFILAYVVSVLFQTVASNVGVVGKYWSITAVQHGVPIAFGLISFLMLQLNPKTVKWADEVLIELRKVTWPTRKETTAMTLVTCIMLLVAGVGLGLFDMVSKEVVNILINLKL